MILQLRNATLPHPRIWPCLCQSSCMQVRSRVAKKVMSKVDSSERTGKEKAKILDRESLSEGKSQGSVCLDYSSGNR